MSTTRGTHWSIGVSVAPTFEPVALAHVRSHLRVDGTTEDGYLGDLLASVRARYERDNGLALCTQTLVQQMDRFPATIELMRWPVTSIASITYVDGTGASQTVAPSDYLSDLISAPARIRPAHGRTWPAARDQVNAVAITFTAGYAAGAAPPEDVQNLLEIIARRFSNRGDEAWVGSDPWSPNRLWLF